ncbi:hypothetical protein [Segniliparus rugosus]|uniref:Holliday junction resolvase RuvC n=1 Tax=Segniliparus rugosus (strain ATCC BAA-974 / DSM 45345 / CCUG 50838 / CIP 108380 / JCM 13579 / CDC 945) TaxID=679197 RepID=E5XMT6_SEGRC|nr:hypothetical protein [Segniliparus rugosus]EFV14356.1 hypothetical protein HMPREF9336_00806 [Segniliparus rugosus ATCC BAA-974]
MTTALPLRAAKADRPLRGAIVGLTLASRPVSAGIAVLGAGSAAPFVTTVSSAECRDRVADHLARHRSLVDEIMAAVLDQCESVAMIVIEDLSHVSAADSPQCRAHVWWELVNRLHCLGVPVAVCAPSTLKKFAVGTGNAKKLEVFGAAQHLYPELVLKKDDEADAIFLALIGAVALGRETPLSATQTRRKVLTAVQWPDAERGAPVPF